MLCLDLTEGRELREEKGQVPHVFRLRVEAVEELQVNLNDGSKGKIPYPSHSKSF